MVGRAVSDKSCWPGLETVGRNRMLHSMSVQPAALVFDIRESGTESGVKLRVFHELRSPRGMKMSRLVNATPTKSGKYDGIANPIKSWTHEPQEHHKMLPPKGERAGEISERRGSRCRAEWG